MMRPLLSWALLFAALCVVPTARAASSDERCSGLAAEAAGWGERGLPWSAFGPVERESLVAALCASNHFPVYEPEGRTVCAVSTFRQPPFVEGEHLPVWLNRFHADTRDETLLSLARIRPGAVWTDALRMDVGRRMATPGVLSVAVAVPVETTACEGGVEVLLVSRDIWSLRFVARPEIDGGELTRITLGATENNLGGRHLQLALVGYKDRDFWEIGPVLQQRRMGGSMLTGALSGAVIFTPALAGEAGYRAAASIVRPVETASDDRGWSVAAAGEDRRFAIYRGNRIAAYDDPTTQAIEAAPAIWRSSNLSASVGTTFARGQGLRQLYTPYFAGSAASYALSRPDNDAIAAAFKRDLLPQDELRIGPGLRWTLYEPRYRSLQNFRLFGVAEEVRDGPTVTLDGSLSDPLFGASRPTQALSADLSWNGQLAGEDLLRAAAGGAIGLGDGLEDSSSFAELRVVTPASLRGRLHLRAAWVERWRNRSRRFETAGGDEALRGFAPAALRAESLIRANLEWRSLPYRSYLSRIGAALFADAAEGRGEASTGEPLLSVGAGLRFFLPQMNSFVVSADLGVPILTGGLTEAGIPMAHLRIDQPF